MAVTSSGHHLHHAHPSGNYQYTLVPASEPSASASGHTKTTTTRRSSSGGGGGSGATGKASSGGSAGSYQRAIACLILLFVCMQFLLSLSSSSSSGSSAGSGTPPFRDHRKHALWFDEFDGEVDRDTDRRNSGMSRGALSRPDYQYPADPAAAAADSNSTSLSKSWNTSHVAILPLKPCPPVPPALGEQSGVCLFPAVHTMYLCVLSGRNIRVSCGQRFHPFRCAAALCLPTFHTCVCVCVSGGGCSSSNILLDKHTSDGSHMLGLHC